MPKENAKILVVDDEPTISGMLAEALMNNDYRVDVAHSGLTALDMIHKDQYDLVITDLYLPDIKGIEVLKSAKEVDPDTGVIMITGHSSVETAVEAMRIGAFDYLTKGFSLNEIQVTVDKFLCYQNLIKENKLLRSELKQRYGIENIIGKSPAMQKVFEIVDMVAPTNATVLIQGPSGTGKEIIAKAIHQCSERRDFPFIKTNCAAMPEGLIESELFGHERGAFTGAVKRTTGRFELANHGTLLLDEVSEIKPSLQAKLLRVLQEKEFEKVGNPETIQVDVRIIATTNRDLHSQIAKGAFREDLYYRLNVVPILLPRLKDRKEDIPLLADFFIEKYSTENNKEIKELSEDSLTHLLEHDWPGNVRELENTIERAVVICKEDIISPKHLYFVKNKQDQPPENPPITFPHGLTTKEIERLLITQRLREKKGNRTQAAAVLGISVRTLRNKLRDFQISDDDEVQKKS